MGVSAAMALQLRQGTYGAKGGRRNRAMPYRREVYSFRVWFARLPRNLQRKRCVRN